MKIEFSAIALDNVESTSSRRGSELLITADMVKPQIREMMAEGLKHLTMAEFHDWLNEFVPQYAKALEKVEG
jgi:hypothetical protein